MDAQNWQWVVPLQTGGSVEVKNICYDPDGCLFVAGVYDGFVIFDEKAKFSLSGDAGFLLKLSPCREPIWVRSFAYSNDNDGYHNIGLDTDSKGNVALAFTQNQEACVLKYSPAGTLMFTFLADTPPPGWFEVKMSSAKDLCIDPNDNIVFCGKFKGNTRFGSTTLNSGSHMNLFIGKLSPSFDLLWVSSLGSGDKIDAAWDIDIDPQGNIYATGWLNQTNFVGYYRGDIYLNKYAPGGSLIWSLVTKGGSGSTTEHHVVLDKKGENAYLYGGLKKTGEFGKDVLTVNSLDIWNPYDMYLAKVNAKGEWQWARKTATHAIDNVASNGIDPSSGTIWDGRYLAVTGAFPNTFLFDNQKRFQVAQPYENNFFALFDLTNGNAPLTQTVEITGRAREEKYRAEGAVTAHDSLLFLGNALSASTVLGNKTVVSDSIGGNAFWALWSKKTPEMLEIYGQKVICNDKSVQLSVPGCFKNIKWSTGESSNKITVNKPGNYFVTVSDQHCPMLSDSVRVDLFSGKAKLQLDSASGQLRAAPQGVSCTWFLDGQSSASGPSHILNPPKTGHWHAQVTYANGCVALTDTLLVFGGDATLEKAILYPNPADIQAFMNINMTRPSNMILDVFNETGQIMYTKKQDSLWKSKIELPTNQWASGVYFVRLSWAKDCLVKRLRVMH